MIVALMLIAGGVGAVARFVTDGAVKSRVESDFPWATLAINVTGSLLLGVLTGLVIFAGAPDDVRTVLGTGFCGGFTTFSTASFETVRIAQRGMGVRSLVYPLSSVVLCVAAAGVGLAVTR